jgi:hypothetical protein
MLLPLLFLSFILILGYYVQVYQVRRSEKATVCVEELKIASARASTDSRGRSPSGGWRIEKVE